MAKVITENFKIETTNELFNSFKSQNSTLGANFLSQLQAYDVAQSGFTLTSANENAIKAMVDDQLTALRPEANYYIMASSSLASVDGVPPVTNTQVSKRDFQRKVIFGTKIEDSSARYMFYQNAWVDGTVYDAFDDIADIETLNVLVTIRNTEGEYLVFKCIENNNGSPSTVSPQTVIEQFATANYQSVETEDKYIWHYMFTVNADESDIYKTVDSLPLPPVYGDVNVIANAKENISQIIVESTPIGQFNQYLFGEATGIANSSSVLVKSSSISQDITTLVLGITDKVGRSLYQDLDAYKYMYFRSATGSTQGKLYQVISSTANDATKEITVQVRTNDVISSSGSGQLVPKIEVSSSTLSGTRARAYGIIDQFGTLTRVAFETKGTEYKFASAQVIYPKSLSTPGITTLRTVISPKGGHGSNPIDEMAMSRLTIVTDFIGQSVNIPDSNTYTQVGLLKNPTFTDSTGASTTPLEFDNRIVLTVSGDKTSDAPADSFFEQYIRTIDIQDIVGGEHYVINDAGNLTDAEWDALATTTISGALGTSFTSISTPSVGLNKTGTVSVAVDNLSPDEEEEIVKAKVHQSVYDGSTNTKIYLVDYYGDFESKVQLGNIRIKSTVSSTNATTININTIEYGDYDSYSGELLHFLDFSPITRSETSREKVKFTFDF